MRWITNFFGFVGVLSLVSLLVFGLGTQAAQAASLNNQASQSQVFAAPLAQIEPLAAQAFREWSRGELTDVISTDAKHEIKGLSRTNVFKFVDDLTVSLVPVAGDPAQTEVTVESVGRLGEYDFGGNQRNIDEYLSTLQSLLEKTSGSLS